MILWHVTTFDLLQKYLASGFIENPVRAWKSLAGAERFARQTGRKLIIMLHGKGEFRPLGGHQDQALVSDKPYKLTSEDLNEMRENKGSGTMKLTREFLKKLIKEAILNEMAITGLHFAITGTISMPRRRFVDLVEANGGVFDSSVRPTTDYLVVGAGIGRNKISKAADMGIKVIDENEFIHMMRGGRRTIKDNPEAWRGTSGRGVGEYRRDRRFEEARKLHEASDTRDAIDREFDERMKAYEAHKTREKIQAAKEGRRFSDEEFDLEFGHLYEEARKLRESKIKNPEKTTTIELDIAYDTDTGLRTKKWANKYNCEAQKIIEIGPGGGNPVYKFTGKEKDLYELCLDYSGDDEEEALFYLYGDTEDIKESRKLNEGLSDQPTDEQIEDWMNEGEAQATDGCWVELDGTCEHGKKSWLLVLGLI